mmetsp:Transcript_20046/g.53389  ORF Transcript_20046/g.53389 Transcript_20046/m.53389 type:complete len:359 (-) Transcript_20046:278-1354(-)
MKNSKSGKKMNGSMSFQKRTSDATSKGGITEHGSSHTNLNKRSSLVNLMSLVSGEKVESNHPEPLDTETRKELKRAAMNKKVNTSERSPEKIIERYATSLYRARKLAGENLPFQLTAQQELQVWDLPEDPKILGITSDGQIEASASTPIELVKVYEDLPEGSLFSSKVSRFNFLDYSASQALTTSMVGSMNFGDDGSASESGNLPAKAKSRTGVLRKLFKVKTSEASRAKNPQAATSPPSQDPKTHRADASSPPQPNSHPASPVPPFPRHARRTSAAALDDIKRGARKVRLNQEVEIVFLVEGEDSVVAVPKFFDVRRGIEELRHFDLVQGRSRFPPTKTEPHPLAKKKMLERLSHLP